MQKPGTLYLIATPIGNLGDLSKRAAEVLGRVDTVFCEDTRHSLTLLRAYGIQKPLKSLHKFNEKAAAETVAALLKEGKDAALISDAGTPLISDPGGMLLDKLRADGLPFTLVPGPCALIGAVVLSGMGSGGFAFAGFLPSKNKDRDALLRRFKDSEVPVVLYSAPHDVCRDVAALYAAFGDRRYCAVREMTKIYEETRFGTLAEGYTGETRGEFVLVVDGAPPPQNPLNALSPEAHVAHYRAMGLSPGDAAKAAAKDRGCSKSEMYRYTIQE